MGQLIRRLYASVTMATGNSGSGTRMNSAGPTYLSPSYMNTGRTVPSASYAEASNNGGQYGVGRPMGGQQWEYVQQTRDRSIYDRAFGQGPMLSPGIVHAIGSIYGAASGPLTAFFSHVQRLCLQIH